MAWMDTSARIGGLLQQIPELLQENSQNLLDIYATAVPPKKVESLVSGRSQYQWASIRSAVAVASKRLAQAQGL